MQRRRALLALTAAGAVVAAISAGLAHPTAPGENGLIAFQRYRLSDDPLWAEIYVSRVDGTGERRLTQAPRGYVDGNPDWSPDGSLVAFDRCLNRPPLEEYDRCTVWVVRPDGTDAMRLSCRPLAPSRTCTNDSQPSFAPDGKRLIVVRGSTIVELDLDGTTRRVLARERFGGRLFGPALSPYGGRLAFIRADSSRAPRADGRAAFVANADGSRERQVTPWSLNASDQLDWSPDGWRILFRGGRGADFDRGQGNLYTVGADGRGLRRLTHFAQRAGVLRTGSYSPDGRSIVFATTIGATSVSGSDLPDVFVMAVDGTHVRPVTRARNWDGTADWGRKR